MGMFTQLSHNGKIYQFKTGFDDLRIYRVGDTIPWEPDPRYPGEHIDGVHPACDENGDDRLWVIIKDCKIIAIDSGAPSDWPGYENQLLNRYSIRSPPRELWSDLAWAEKAARDAQQELAYQRYVAEHPGATPVEYYVHTKLQERSFTQQILPPARDPDYTPGPWHAIHTPGNTRLTIHGEVYDVAITRPAGSIEREAANARLIAQAPEMLEILSVLVGVFDPDKQCVYEFARPLIERARETIKKARV